MYGGGSDYNLVAPALDTCGRIAPTLPNAAWVMEAMVCWELLLLLLVMQGVPPAPLTLL